MLHANQMSTFQSLSLKRTQCARGQPRNNIPCKDLPVSLEITVAQVFSDKFSHGPRSPISPDSVRDSSPSLQSFAIVQPSGTLLISLYRPLQPSNFHNISSSFSFQSLSSSCALYLRSSSSRRAISFLCLSLLRVPHILLSCVSRPFNKIPIPQHIGISHRWVQVGTLQHSAPCTFISVSSLVSLLICTLSSPNLSCSNPCIHGLSVRECLLMLQVYSRISRIDS